MYYENSMRITLKNEEAAAAALKIMKVGLSAGFACDKTYKHCPSTLMQDNLMQESATVVLPDGFSCLIPEDAQSVLVDLLQSLAENLHEPFTCTIFNDSDYSQSEIAAEYSGKAMKAKTIYYPNGFVETLCCDECGMDVVAIDEYEYGKTYICPECGEEVDLSDAYEENKPVITKSIITII